MGAMRRPAATIGSLVFFLLAPGVFAGLVPWLLTGFESRPSPQYAVPLRVVGTVLAVAGGAVLVQAFARFVLEGSGTPAPMAPTARLVVGGLYRYVRNPMYLAVLAVIVGLALALWQPWLLVYAAVVALSFAVFVRVYEEPTLTRKYGAEYEAYCMTVPRWVPRMRPSTRFP
jgi:protein-S-isoprenylcysteine O-methyltransferase Ste14